MASGVRVLKDFTRGSLDAALAAGEVTSTMSSPALVDVPAIAAGSGRFVPIVIDPLGEANGPEIVHVTEHAASATTATVQRAQEGTTSVAHASAAKWHIAVTEAAVSERTRASFVAAHEHQLGTLTIAVMEAVEQWGTVYSITDLPPGQVSIQATLTGIVTDWGPDDYHIYGIQVSWDGGATWVTLENQTWKSQYDTTPAQDDRWTLAITGVLAGTPDPAGEVQIRAYGQQYGGTGTVFTEGVLSILVIGDAAASNASSFTGARVEKAVAQSIPHQTLTSVTFGAADVVKDSDAFFDDPNDQFVVPAGAGGTYLVNAWTYWASNSTGARMTRLTKNGAGLTGGVAQVQANGATGVTHALLMQLEPGDTVGLTAQQTSGGALDLVQAFLSITKLGQSVAGALADLADVQDATPAANSLLSYSAADAEWQAVNRHGFSGVRLLGATTQAVTVDTFVDVEFATEEYDTDGYFDAATSAVNVTVPEDGYYLLTGEIEVDNLPAGEQLMVQLWGAGSVQTQEKVWSPAANSDTLINASTVCQLSAGDTVKMQAAAGGGANYRNAKLTVTRVASTQNTSSFTGAKVRLSGTQAVATSSLADVDYGSGTVDYDSDGFFDAAQDAFVIPVGMGGKYLLTAQATWAASDVGQRVQYFSGPRNYSRKAAKDSSEDTMSLVIDLAAGDVVKHVVYQDSGGSLNLGGGNSPVHMSITKLGQAVTNLDGLHDVDAGSPTDLQELVYNATTGKWEATTPAALNTDFSGAQMRRAAGEQTLSPVNTWLTIEMDTVNYDTDSYADLATDSFTVAEDGKYILHGVVQTASETDLHLRFQINGANSDAKAPGRGRMQAQGDTVAVTSVADLVAGDVVTLAGYGTGGTISAFSTAFSLTRVQTLGVRSSYEGAGVAKESGTQALTVGAWNKITFDVEQWDSSAIWDPTNNRFVIVEKGRYLVTAGVYISAVGDNIIAIRDSAGVNLAQQRANSDRPTCSVVLDLNPGDVLECSVWPVDAGTWDVVGGAAGNGATNRFTVSKLGQAVTKDNLHTHPAEADTSWHNVGDPGEPAYENGWLTYAADYFGAGFRKDADGYVQLRGLVKSGTQGSRIFQLPVGYRPASQPGGATLNHHMPVAVASDTHYATVRGDGSVQGPGHANAATWTDLSSIRFLAEQ